MRNYDGKVLSIFRPLRLLLGSLCTTSFLDIISTCIDLQDTQPSNELLKSIVDHEPSISLQVLQDCFKIILHQRTLTGWTEFEALHQFLAALCVYYTGQFSDRFELDVPFMTFVSHSTVCQFLPQQERIVAWIHMAMLKSKSDKEIVLPLMRMMKESFSSVHIHSLHLLAHLQTKHSTSPSVISHAYSFIGQDPSIDQQQLILQQCIQGNELDWNTLVKDWQIFPHSLEFLMKILMVYPQPLKVLSTISLLSLHHMFENTTVGRFGPVLKRIARSVELISECPIVVSIKFLPITDLRIYC